MRKWRRRIHDQLRIFGWESILRGGKVWRGRRSGRDRPCGGQKDAGGKEGRGSRGCEEGMSCWLRLRRTLDRECVGEELDLCLGCRVWCAAGAALTAEGYGTEGIS